MRSHANLYIFLSLFWFYMPVWGEIDRQNSDWQEQILQQIDPDEFSEQQYAHLLEMLDELSLHQSDTNIVSSRQQLFLRTDRCLNQRAGYRHATPQRREEGKAYLGDPWHHTLRYQLERRDSRRHQWRAGLVMDKDAGEKWQQRPPYADSFNAFAAYSAHDGILRQAVVGHYRLQLGSGLILNQQFSLGKNLIGSEFLHLSPRLTPHASASEGAHMQGAALRLRLGRHLEVLPFVSAQQIDGSLTHDTLTSWSTDGYHRTHNENGKRHTSWMTNIGMRAQSMGEWWEVGASLLYSQFEHDFVRPLRRYNANYFRGHQLTQFSVDYRVQYLGCQMRGEAAIDDHSAFATIHGLSREVANGWKGTLLYRYYGNKYRQIMGAAMAESSAMQGEQGVTLLLDGDLVRGWHMQGTFDYWHFSQAQYGCYQPSWGYEVSARASWNGVMAQRPTQLSLRYRIKAKQKNDTQTDIPDDILGYYRHSVDATFSVEPLRGMLLRTQARGRFYSDQNLQSNGCSPDFGMAFSEALIWQRKSSPLHGELQAAWFRAETYDCRLYLTERNILYGFSMPMLYGEGVRYTCTLSYKISERIQAEAKYAFTNYKDKTSISSGLQAIEGNTKQDLWLQIRAKF